MANSFGFGTDTTNFSGTVRENIQKAVVATLRAGLVCLPRGAVVPADMAAQRGDSFTLRVTEYPDLEDDAATVPLTEGVPPSAVKLGISTLDYTVQQVGAVTNVTDIGAYQSPHDLRHIAADKIARLAAQVIDNLALTALQAHAVDDATAAILSTETLLNAKAELAGRNVQPIPGVGYYAILHPFALRGLEGEASLNGYVDVVAQAKAGDLTKGAVSQYRGVTFLPSTRVVDDGAGNYPVYFIGMNSIAFGDVSTIEYSVAMGADKSDPLAQLASFGFKGILGGKVISFAEETDGAGVNGAAVPRIWTASVTTGVTV